MPSHNRDVLISGIRALVLRDETARADDIQGCNAEETFGVVCAFCLEYLGADGDSAVDRVGDDQNVGIWGGVCDGFGQIPDDGGVSVEEVCERALLEDCSEVGDRRVWEMREERHHRGSCLAFLVRRRELGRFLPQ